ncbi:hypothetical protein [Mycobacterium sp. C31M]
MSLLDKGNETVTVYPEIATTSPDGNIKVKPSDTGVTCTASVQFIGSADDPAFAAGDGTVSKYRLRLKGYPEKLGSASQIEWNGDRYTIDGEPRVFNGSPRTAHVSYVIVRR